MLQVCRAICMYYVLCQFIHQTAVRLTKCPLNFIHILENKQVSCKYAERFTGVPSKFIKIGVRQHLVTKCMFIVGQTSSEALPALCNVTYLHFRCRYRQKLD